MAVLTVHHWTDPRAGLTEMARVTARQVVLCFEPLRTHDFWALEYFPEALELTTEQDPPAEAFLRAQLPVREVRTLLVPHDCTDGSARRTGADPRRTSTLRSRPACRGWRCSRRSTARPAASGCGPTWSAANGSAPRVAQQLPPASRAGGSSSATSSPAKASRGPAADTARRDAALASGARYLWTDYDVADKTLGYTFVVELPGGAPARCNPANVPEASDVRPVSQLT